LTSLVFTDDVTDLDECVHSLPLPDLWDGWWNKISLFRDDLFPAGEIILYFDLDIVITNNIDFLLEGDDTFVVCRRFSDGNKFGCNSSVMKISSGSLSYVYKLLNNNPKLIDKYRSDQDLISDIVEDLIFFPKSKIVSFKLCLKSHVWGNLHSLKIGKFLPEIRPPIF